MIAETGAALGGIKAAFDIAKRISALKSEAERNDAIINIQRVLLQAQESALADKHTISELRSKIASNEHADIALADWKREKSRYVLTRSPIGSYFYALRPEMAFGGVQHRVCATCFEDGRKSILNTMASHSGGELVVCQRCEKQTMLAEFQTRSTGISEGGYY